MYLDDILVFSKTDERTLDHFRRVLTLLRNAGNALKLKSVLSSLILLAARVMSFDRDDWKWRRRQRCNAGLTVRYNQTELSSFLGICNLYRRFVPEFSKKAALLNMKLCKEEPETLPTLTKPEIHSVDALKSTLASPNILVLPRANGHYILETGAGDTRVGCVLLQTQESKPTGQ